MGQTQALIKKQTTVKDPSRNTSKARSVARAVTLDAPNEKQIEKILNIDMDTLSSYNKSIM